VVAAHVPRVTLPESSPQFTAMKRRQFVWCLSVLLVPSLLTGCHTLKPEADEGYTGDDATWGKSYRPPAKKKEKFFFDEKAQQIEESLGM
jgi:hypothetical protein